MNDVQRNFKRQIKQVEHEKKQYWRKEHYHDRYTGKNYLRYYDEHGTLLKTTEAKISFKGLLSALFTIVGILILIGIVIFIWYKFHVVIF